MTNPMAPRPPKFLRALYDILTHEPTHILAWAPCGSSFQVFDVAQLEQHVLPKYFKHNKFASFQRQLNNFGFRKWTKTRASVCTFSHDALVRCAPSELAAMVARCGIASPHSGASASTPQAKSSFCGKRLRASSCDDSCSGDGDEMLVSELKKVKPTAIEDADGSSEPIVSVDDLLALDWSACGDIVGDCAALDDSCFGLPIELLLFESDIKVADWEPLALAAENAADPGEWQVIVGVFA